MAEVRIAVLAGTNGAGKSSVGGALLRQVDAAYFNPDEVAKEILERYSELSPGEANVLAWQEGLRQLQDAIHDPHDYAFETTLGGNTITNTLLQAIDAGLEVSIWYVGLSSPELHIARVKARVALGGHAIPEAKIRERFESSRLNLIRLMPFVAELNTATLVMPHKKTILTDRICGGGHAEVGDRELGSDEHRDPAGDRTV